MSEVWAIFPGRHGGSPKSPHICTALRLTAEGTQRVAPAGAAISHAEHFEDHALTAQVRLERVAQTAT